jgi:hypothetical protein
MNSLKSAPRHWTPVNDRDRTLVLDELDRIIASAQFCNSKRYPALLRYVVEETLAGHAEQLKERTLGIEVFHRPLDYDTNADTVVRYTAGEVRKRLALYYHQHAETPLQIVLPSGSYVPDFLRARPEPAEGLSDAGVLDGAAHAVELFSFSHAGIRTIEPQRPFAASPASSEAPHSSHRLRWFAAVVLLVLAAGLLWRLAMHKPGAVAAFWSPMVREHEPMVLCVGGNTFADKNFSGVQTALKGTEYPFVSMQIVSSVSQISGLLEREGATYSVQASSSTQLPELRDHPIVFLGGYNNDWTMQLMSPLRYHFSAEPMEAIVDTQQPGRVWARDRSQPYASADDYAIVARFRDNVTGSMAVVAAGLGRNGTELAAQFLTSERYMGVLQQTLGGRFSTANVEVLLHSRVIYGKTGAPQIEAVYAW